LLQADAISCSQRISTLRVRSIWLNSDSISIVSEGAERPIPNRGPPLGRRVVHLPLSHLKSEDRGFPACAQARTRQVSSEGPVPRPMGRPTTITPGRPSAVVAGQPCGETATSSRAWCGEKSTPALCSRRPCQRITPLAPTSCARGRGCRARVGPPIATSLSWKRFVTAGETARASLCLDSAACGGRRLAGLRDPLIACPNGAAGPARSLATHAGRLGEGRLAAAAGPRAPSRASSRGGGPDGTVHFGCRADRLSCPARAEKGATARRAQGPGTQGSGCRV
jgi:hypothetical protein